MWAKCLSIVVHGRRGRWRYRSVKDGAGETYHMRRRRRRPRPIRSALGSRAVVPRQVQGSDLGDPGVIAIQVPVLIKEESYLESVTFRVGGRCEDDLLGVNILVSMWRPTRLLLVKCNSMEQLHIPGIILFQVTCGRPTVRVGNPRCTEAGNGTFRVPLIFMQQDWAGLALNPASFEFWQRGGLMNNEQRGSADIRSCADGARSSYR